MDGIAIVIWNGRVGSGFIVFGDYLYTILFGVCCPSPYAQP